MDGHLTRGHFLEQVQPVRRVAATRVRDYFELASPDLPGDVVAGTVGVVAGGVADAGDAADAADEAGLPAVVLCPLGLSLP